MESLPSSQKCAIFMVGGGHFAGAVFDGYVFKYILMCSDCTPGRNLSKVNRFLCLILVLQVFCELMMFVSFVSKVIKVFVLL